MSITNDGGPAFPVSMFNRQADGMPMTAAEFFDGGNGMTLRDYFAKGAMEAYVNAIGVNPDYCKILQDTAKTSGVADATHFIAVCSYEFADAMLAARKGEA
jgi:hypothetical protein